MMDSSIDGAPPPVTPVPPPLTTTKPPASSSAANITSFLTKSPCLVAQVLFFLYKFGDSLLEPTVKLYIYQSACLKELHNLSDCIEIQEHPAWEAKVQQLSAGYLLGYKTLNHVPPIIIGLFCGSWSDHIGRKIPLLLPCFGTIVAVMLYMLSMVAGEYATLPLVMTGACIRGLVGRSAVIIMALYSYIADVTSKEERTQKLGQLLAMNYFGYFCGSLLVGALFGFTTYAVILGVVVVTMIVVVVVCLLFMDDSVHHAPTIDSEDKVKAIKKNPFHIDHIKEAFAVILKHREQNARMYILILFATIIFSHMCKSGEKDITLLFIKRSPLSWSESLYGYLVAVQYACLSVGVMIILPALMKWGHMGDMSLVIIGVLSKIVGLLLLAFSDVTWMVFMAEVINGPASMISSVCKSMLSKSIRPDEMGKAFSLLSCCETVSSFLGSLIFTLIYISSVSFFPGLTFLSLGAAYIILLLSLITVFYIMHRDEKSNFLYGQFDKHKSYGTSDNIPASSDKCNITDNTIDQR